VQEELESICSRLYERIRRLFPLLPTPDSPCWLVSPDTGEQLIVTPNTVLLPLLLPPLHPTIFTLYALRYDTLLYYSCWYHGNQCCGFSFAWIRIILLT
jgi:hypothetical protein